MATITGTQGEKIDQVTQLLLALQAQIRVIQWLGGIFSPLLIALGTWVVLTNNSTRVDIATLQGKMELLNQRMDQKVDILSQRMDQKVDMLSQRMDHMDKRMDHMENTLDKIDARLTKIEERLNKPEKQP